MFFKKKIEDGKEKLQTVTVITVEYKLKDNDEIFRRKNVAGFRRNKGMFIIFIYVPGKEHFDQISIPLDCMDYFNCLFTKKPVYTGEPSDD